MDYFWKQVTSVDMSMDGLFAGRSVLLEFLHSDRCHHHYHNHYHNNSFNPTPNNHSNHHFSFPSNNPKNILLKTVLPNNSSRH